jgi:hypothetical protein
MQDLIVQNKLYHFEMEYDIHTNNNENLERRQHLQCAINKLKNVSNTTNSLERFDTMLDRIETASVKKPFYRLNLFQKETILKSYIEDSLKIPKSKQQSILKQILALIAEKKIVTANITYNVETSKLTSINNIMIDANNDVVSIVKKERAKKEKKNTD